MARKRGFLAELQYQNQQAEKRRRQQAAAAYRAQLAAQRQAERSRLAAERARAAVNVAALRERERLEKEVARLHVESQLAEVEFRNASFTYPGAGNGHGTIAVQRDGAARVQAGVRRADRRGCPGAVCEAFGALCPQRTGVDHCHAARGPE